ncbi:MAG: hypothetical protein QGH62_02095, partial [Nitrospinaceae bacterium]|nr:hypothetical protein [Nitrospinaceae bacterium]
MTVQDDNEDGVPDYAAEIQKYVKWLLDHDKLRPLEWPGAWSSFIEKSGRSLNSLDVDLGYALRRVELDQDVTNCANIDALLPTAGPGGVKKPKELPYALLMILYHHYQANATASDRNRAEAAKADYMGPVTKGFTYTGRIIGFIELVKHVMVLPREQVKVDYGAGIDTFFYIVRLSLVNEADADLLIYGESIQVPCDLFCMKYDRPKEYRKLAKVDYRKRLSVEDNIWWWGNKPEGAIKNGGAVLSVSRFMMPMPKTLVSDGFDRREFKRPKNLFLRILDGVGDVSASLIPVVTSINYADGVGIAIGTVLPTIKDIWGDATEVQRQTFLSDALDRYTELKRGEELSQVIF